MSASRYDYIVVGAGSAGCVLAARLSEDPAVRVALVESGGRDRKQEFRVPAAFPKLFKTSYDWNFTTTAQPELGGRELYWPRGHTLGGCSSLNAMMWVRGHRDDYDAWGEVAGAEWSYDALEPYFRRAERWTGPVAAGSSVYGADGPLHISPPRDPNPLTEAFLRACREDGLPDLPELNGPDHSGCALTPLNQRGGRRWSAADGYLRPAARRANLDVLTNTRVCRLEFEGSRVVGVVADGVPGVLRADREVILSAGAIGSPHLLMLSGIGDPDHLKEVGIPLRAASPEVGCGLKDHLSFAVTSHCPTPVTLTGADTLANVGRFLLTRRGPLTSNLAEAVAFVRSSPELAAPDLELIFAPAPFIDHGLTAPTEHGITIGVVLLQPESTGHITLTSPDPLVAPRIAPRYLTAPPDLTRLLAGIRRAESLLGSAALTPYASKPMPPYPGRVDDETLTESIRSSAQTLYHPVGTCRMGSDEGSVTDPRLRVRGVQGLRVVDASVMPGITRGHTHAPVVAIAERAVEMVGEDAPG
ncbi:GMC family oxidoreductase N-terminal domain-containing protein [Streptomyces sp. NBC_01142]|uniref:GMC family oxidoreductase n=1 Tax=Streptomyces sp. NBC_01142 TaxID=2975865 RepID=UPI0022535B30|nr:GMC family oxidoreductase N-terminal domain-containing protein [Streptomyces sp. NBC_01142]MCX4820621.1 GMC family oxidoreductase N-terminal domain-containing protein [Streptomyces sp. NBC_01142]